MLDERRIPTHTPFRRDIEGLRAIAVAMVLLYHIDTNVVSGGFAGVDVFFVISGFLITTLLLGEAETTGKISLVTFYARRAKRLLPAAAAVLVVTALLSWQLLPATRWLELGGDIVAAAFYFINWRLAWRSVDYLAEDSVASPVQHFWSLAVEEQYYLLWPALLLLGLWMVRGRISARVILGAILLVIGAGSFAWSVYATHAAPGPAYFATSTRLWELAVGGVLVLAARRWESLPHTAACLLGWAGLCAVVVAALWITPDVAWPGYAAILPVFGAAAVIASGPSAGRHGPIAVLGRPVMCWLGGLSYSLYLWHWPLFAIAHERIDVLSSLQRWGLVLLTLVLAWLSRRFIEDPVRRSRTLSTQPGRALTIGFNLSLIGTVAGLALVALVSLDGKGQTGEASVRLAGERVALGAAILRSNPRNDPRGAPVNKEDWITPVPALATKDVPDAYNTWCHLRSNGSEPVACVYGNPNAAVTIAMAGDSKVAQWLPAMQLLVERHDWRVVSYTKSNCAFNSAMRTLHGKPYEACYEWNRAVMKKLLGSGKPDYLLTTQQHGSKGGADPKIVSSLLDWWRPLQDAGVEIVVIANNKKPPIKGYECIEKHPDKMKKCTYKRGQPRSNSSLRAAVKQLPGTKYIDLTDAICPTKRCAPVIGNVLVYRQGSHITKTYAQTLAPRLEAALLDAGVPSVARSADSPGVRTNGSHRGR